MGLIEKVAEKWELTEAGKQRGAKYLSSQKYGTWIAWPKNIIKVESTVPGVEARPFTEVVKEHHQSATTLGRTFGIPVTRMNYILSELGGHRGRGGTGVVFVNQPNRLTGFSHTHPAHSPHPPHRLHQVINSSPPFRSRFASCFKAACAITSSTSSTSQQQEFPMKVNKALRKQQQVSTIDLKDRAQKAEQLLVEIETCEQVLAKLNESLSAVLGIGSTPAPEAKAPPVAVAQPVSKRKGGRSATLRDSIRDFLIQAGKPMRLAEIVKGMKQSGHVFTAKKPLLAIKKMLYDNKKMFKKAGRGLFKAG